MRNCVLVIEHDPSVSRFMQMKLEEAGFSCLVDNTGDSAVDLAGQRQAELIVLDPDEPLKNGQEILNKFGKSAPFRLFIFPLTAVWMPRLMLLMPAQMTI